jgi:gamma-glutamyltranspeptidase/glutathione hydrolase
MTSSPGWAPAPDVVSTSTEPARRRVAVAAPSELAAAAGARLGAEGGNGVDAALAAMMVACVSEPGVVSLAGGAFVTVAPPDGGPAVTIDGYVEMPGRGLPAHAFGRGTRELVTAYGGHTAMTVGHGSAATPGALAAIEEAHRRYGRAPWRSIVEPAIEVSRQGFPLGSAAGYYFEYVRDALFGQDPSARAALHHHDGTPIRVGGLVRIPDLADFLERVAVEGAAALYRGDVAHAFADDMAANGGLVTLADLEAYAPVVRPAVEVELPGWRFATNPPPSIGGPVLAAMLLLLGDRPTGPWTPDDLAALVRVIRAVLAHRAAELDVAQDRSAAGQALLDAVLTGGPAAAAGWLAAPSTAQVCAVDVDGVACAVTASSGYSAGVSVPGTGLWLNNCLGEHELNRSGLHALAPGERLASNMAPTVGRRHDGAVLAIGSPGADRITTALAQVIASIVGGGYELQAAIDRPRLHVRRTVEGAETLEYEHDLDLPDALLPPSDVLPRHPHHGRAMYFGGVAAALREPDGELSAAADPRRAGAVALG